MMEGRMVEENGIFYYQDEELNREEFSLWVSQNYDYIVKAAKAKIYSKKYYPMAGETAEDIASEAILRILKSKIKIIKFSSSSGKRIDSFIKSLVSRAIMSYCIDNMRRGSNHIEKHRSDSTSSVLIFGEIPAEDFETIGGISGTDVLAISCGPNTRVNEILDRIDNVLCKNRAYPVLFKEYFYEGKNILQISKSLGVPRYIVSENFMKMIKAIEAEFRDDKEIRIEKYLPSYYSRKESAAI